MMSFRELLIFIQINKFKQNFFENKKKITSVFDFFEKENLFSFNNNSLNIKVSLILFMPFSVGLDKMSTTKNM